MRKHYSILFFLFSIVTFSQVTWQGGSNPDATSSATILFDKTGTGLATYSGTIYAHTGVTLNGTPWQNVLGSWGNNSTQPALTLVSGNIYKLDLTPTIMGYYGVSSGSITKINLVFRNAAGSAQTSDLSLDVGAFQSSLTLPAENSNTIINSGQNLNISATNTNGNANYNLMANGVSINASTGSSFNYTDANITVNKSYELIISQGITSFSKKFAVIVNAGTVSQAMPSGLEDGINYNSSDDSKATLVLTAPGKDFVYVAGSFNNWVPGSEYLMKRDPSTNKFWLEITGLTSGTNYSYQYWVVDTTPTTNSPAVVKTADPYSTLVLSPFDDSGISSNTYPNLPAYPSGQQREVTLLKTGQTPYNWSSATTNFVKPNKDNLVVYEVLIRDFDSNRNFQDLINKIDYFKNLNINAIELMPVMEFEGNESWGYNTAFHTALDKFYGTEDKFREFIDLCHQNGIAVILDVALNHAFGRNPMVRMWMKDADGDGWGDAASDNPYFNEFAKHSYGVGNDFNHSSAYTKYYTKRVIKHWIEDFKIDGFRWDLTKGFTQACSAGDDSCTNAYQADRVAVLKEYADYSWSLDPNHIAIFEHLGSDNEEQQWANYRLSETPSKGILMWGEMWSKYGALMKGGSDDKDITRMGHVSRGFTGKRLIGYPESHDKDRMVYEGVTFGNGAGAYPVGGNLTNAIKRMSAIGAVSLLIPGPKMIWHFGELGMDDSIFTCNNGSVNSDYDGGNPPGDCKLDTKPQPQWTENWLADVNRSTVYNNWAKMIALKKNNAVFNANYTISGQGGTNNTVRQRVYLYGAAAPLSNVVILANFSVADLAITADFPFTGTWYNLMDNTSMSVTNTAMTITIESGGFRVYGNGQALGLEDFNPIKSLSLVPNPANNYFTLSEPIEKAEIYSITGQLVKSFINVNSVEYQFNIEDLKSGVYLVKAFDANTQSKTIKLIKR
ncbi:alpha-amylase family glycosyl hydrolase [Flavobacterium capsici]|uniref:Alpha-amylase family glycosyl hydrolase n=1 Tax=Flavobacterium capsici TaxID=3075618 RepID=A0AA96F267_9FLAO|nr:MULTISPECIES: alpha-amylase family glycosyl hydrolase [unclassified Flavobacterium]WNM19961.1 alpha-amylase family glycosyl hydrolase [Flavobacterium sp. PMR2A8]WNM21350.1 alpha-amylase family glycosyl hydrolase [Flavobacterium sp. PMTSA4]